MFALESKNSLEEKPDQRKHPSSKIHTLIGHTAEVSSAQFNWDCSRIVTGSMDKTCKLWDALSGKNKKLG